VQLGVAWWKLKHVRTLAHDLHTTLKGPSCLSQNLGDGHIVLMSDVSERLGCTTGERCALN
jgi:hypothetical protein